MSRPVVRKYQTDPSTTGVPILMGVLMTPEVFAAAGPESAGALPQNYAIVEGTRNRRSGGITPRHWKGTLSSGNGPKSVSIPIPTIGFFNGKNDGQTFSYRGSTYTLTKIAEKGYR